MEPSQIVFNIISSVLDIFIVTVFLYQIIKVLIKNEKHTSILIGIFIIIILYFISNVLELNVTKTILDNIFSLSIIIYVILFQNDIKSYLESLGKGKLFFKSRKEEEVKYLDSLINAIDKLASTKTGALITIKRNDLLSKYTSSAVELDANLTEYLLISLFQKESPLHDGAVVIDNEKISHASVYYPIAIDIDISKDYGTRHRAALTISKETDALSIVVSEETGNVSVTLEGSLHSNVDSDFLLELINEKIIQE